MDNFLPANWTLSIWMESGQHLIIVTDNYTSKTLYFPFPNASIIWPVSCPWGNRCVPRLQVKAHQVGIGLSVTPRDKAHLSLVPTSVLHTWRHCTWNRLLWQLDSKGIHDTLAEPLSLLTPQSEWTKENLHRNSWSIPPLNRILGWQLQWPQLEAQPMC